MPVAHSASAPTALRDARVETRARVQDQVRPLARRNPRFDLPRRRELERDTVSRLALERGDRLLERPLDGGRAEHAQLGPGDDIGAGKCHEERRGAPLTSGRPRVQS